MSNNNDSMLIVQPSAELRYPDGIDSLPRLLARLESATNELGALTVETLEIASRAEELLLETQTALQFVHVRRERNLARERRRDRRRRHSSHANGNGNSNSNGNGSGDQIVITDLVTGVRY